MAERRILHDYYYGGPAMLRKTCAVQLAAQARAHGEALVLRVRERLNSPKPLIPASVAALLGGCDTRQRTRPVPRMTSGRRSPRTRKRSDAQRRMWR